MEYEEWRIRLKYDGIDNNWMQGLLVHVVHRHKSSSSWSRSEQPTLTIQGNEFAFVILK